MAYESMILRYDQGAGTQRRFDPSLSGSACGAGTRVMRGADPPHPGWDEFYRETARRAHHGYAAISHNLYERVGEGDAADVAASARLKAACPTTRWSAIPRVRFNGYAHNISAMVRSV